MLEMALAEAETKTQQARRWTYSVSLDDTPDSIAVTPRIKPESIQEAVEKLERSLSKGPEDHQEVRTCLLYAHAIQPLERTIAHTLDLDG